MRQWVLDAEHILDGSWAAEGEAVSNEQVAKRFDQWRLAWAEHLTDGTLSPIERECLEQFLQLFSNGRPYLIQCYDLQEFPRTNNDTERAIRGLKTRYRRISGRKIGTVISCAMAAASPSTTGGNKNLIGPSNWNSTSRR